jgi:hypothetical protein
VGDSGRTILQPSSRRVRGGLPSWAASNTTCGGFMTSAWERAPNLVDEKIQEFRHAPFDHLAKRPYRSELPDSNDDIRYTLFVDRVSDSSVRVVLQAQGTDRDGEPLTFAHGFDMHKNGNLSDIPVRDLWEYH